MEIVTHLLEVVNGNLVSEKVEENVLKSATVTVGEDKSISVDPLGVGRVAVQEAG